MQTSNTLALTNSIDLVCNHSGLNLDIKTRQALLFYFTELQRWNRVTNLTGIKDPAELVFKHLGDTCLLLKLVPDTVRTVLDIGTGAGVPGLIMKIIRSELEMVLAEAVKKKCSFLKFISAGLKLEHTYIEQGLLGPKRPPTHMSERGFDLIVTQATGSVEWFFKTGSVFLSTYGRMIILKGPSGEEEVKAIADFLKRKGFCFTLHKAHLPVVNHQRLLIEIRPAA